MRGASLLLAALARAPQPDSVFTRAPHEVLDLTDTPQSGVSDQAFYQHPVFPLGESRGV